jgi:hypothetical protein
MSRGRKKPADTIPASAPTPERRGVNEAAAPKFALKDLGLQYLMAEHKFVHSSGDIFQRDDLKVVVAHDIAIELGGRVDDPLAHLDARGLLKVRDQVEAIVQTLFGNQAYVTPVARPEEESGEPEIILEAHYALGHSDIDPDELQRSHAQVLERYLNEVPLEAQRQVTLARVAD